MLKLFITIISAVLIRQGIKGGWSGSVVEGGNGNNPKKTVERDQELFNFWGTCISYIGFGVVLLYNGLTG